MAKGNEKSSNSWEQHSGYKPEWAQEIDAEGAAELPSASERFDHAIEMGVQAAQKLERDETLGLIHSSRRSPRRSAAVIAAGALILAGVVVALGSHYSKTPAPTTQQQQDVPAAQDDAPEAHNEEETTFIQTKEEPGGSFGAHVKLTHGTQGIRDTQRVEIPEKIVLDTSQPWFMRVTGFVDESSRYGKSCTPVLSYNGEFGEKSTVNYDDACRNIQESTFEKMYTLPAPFPTVKHKEITPEVAFTGGGVQFDVDFFPVSAVALPWDTSESLDGNTSTFIAFSGSLDNLALEFGNCRVALSIYKPSEGFRYLNDPYAVSIMPDEYLGVLKQELIKELGFDRDDASGYLFVEIIESGSKPPWWQLG
ncbi:MAG: hypothetical protein IKS49_00275 [Actinomycetaceae bacterium]|nr:hypothetical protein [Actinomycetaceae bacterium]